MLKVKKTVHSKQSTAEIDQWENEIKNSIKQMYIQNQNDSKLIEKYENAFETIKKEYALLYKENAELKKAIEQMKSNEKELSISDRKRSRRYEDEYNNNENVQYIVRKKRKTPKIIYEDEEEETDSENDEIDDEKKIEETIEKKRYKKKGKKGISKSIKM